MLTNRPIDINILIEMLRSQPTTIETNTHLEVLSRAINAFEQNQLEDFFDANTERAEQLVTAYVDFADFSKQLEHTPLGGIAGLLSEALEVYMPSVHTFIKDAAISSLDRSSQLAINESKLNRELMGLNSKLYDAQALQLANWVSRNGDKDTAKFAANQIAAKRPKQAAAEQEAATRAAIAKELEEIFTEDYFDAADNQYSDYDDYATQVEESDDDTQECVISDVANTEDEQDDDRSYLRGSFDFSDAELQPLVHRYDEADADDEMDSDFSQPASPRPSRRFSFQFASEGKSSRASQDDFRSEQLPRKSYFL